PSRSTRTISSAIPAATPATSSGRAGSFRSGRGWRRPPDAGDPAPRLSLSVDAAGGVDPLAGQPGGIVRGQEHDRGSDLLRPAEATAERRDRDQGVSRGAPDHAGALGALGVGVAGSDGIDADPSRSQ